jgi:hypothetical protein
VPFDGSLYSWQRLRGIVIGVCGGILVCACSHQAAAPPDPPFAEIRVPGVTESSGLVRSQISASLLWTLNDSGDGPLLYAFDPTGSFRRSFRLPSASNIDWEDLAAGISRDEACLFVADIGDNDRRRTHITVYRVPERNLLENRIPVVEAFSFRYPDQPHDAECLLYFADERVQIVTKEADRPGTIYEGFLTAPGSETVLRKIGQLPISMRSMLTSRAITGGATYQLTKSGRAADQYLVALRSYRRGYLHRGSPDNWFLRYEVRLQMPREQQGEAICFSQDGNSLFTSSEGEPLRIYRFGLNDPAHRIQEKR